MYNNLLLKYAKLAVKKGVNIQKDQLLVISSPIDCSEFARMIADEAYKCGASDVVINYSDEKFNRIRFMNSTKEVLSFTPEFERDKYDYYVDKGAAFLSISAADPNILQGIEPEKISSAQKSRRKALKKYHEACTPPFCARRGRRDPVSFLPSRKRRPRNGTALPKSWEFGFRPESPSSSGLPCSGRRRSCRS